MFEIEFWEYVMSLTGEGSGASILATLEKHLQCQMTLCDALEEIADTLPNRVDKQKCLLTARTIMPVVKSAHLFEEQVLFPTLQIENATSQRLDTAIERLYAEHWEDEGFGDEISEALLAYGCGESFDPEKLGYMLRGFFEGLRRHVAFEKEVLAPLLHQQKTH